MKRKSNSQEKYNKENRKDNENNMHDEDKRIKLVHWEPLAEYEVSSRENDKIRSYLHLNVTGNENITNVLRLFELMRFPRCLTDYLQNLDICRPTPVESQLIPSILNHENVIIKGNRFCGKSLSIKLGSYLLSVENEMKMTIEKNEGPFIIIICLSKEEAKNYYKFISKMNLELKSKLKNIRMSVCIGGESVEEQEVNIREGNDIIICTIGRLLQHISKNTIKFHQLQTVFITDINRLITISDFETVKSLFKHIYDDVQVVSCTTEMNDVIEEYIKLCIPNCSRIDYCSNSLISVNAKHEIERLGNINKLKYILTTLTKTPPPTIIFVNPYEYVLQLPNYFEEMKMSFVYVDKEVIKEKCELLLDDFRDGKYEILIINNELNGYYHLPNVNQVINFDFPLTIDDYIYQSSVCGRRDKIGVVTSYVDKKINANLVKELKRIFEEDKQDIPVFLSSMY